MKNLLLLTLGLIVLNVSAQKKSALSQSFAVKQAKTVKLLMSVNGGSLNIGGSTDNLAEVDLTYLSDYWSPTISYTEDENLGKFLLKTNSKNEDIEDEEKNVCNLALNNSLEYLLGLQIGVGLGEINLENYNIKKGLFRLGIGAFNVNLRNTSVPYLKIDAGVGTASFDLSGEWHNNLKAKVTTGIGEVSFIVPKNVGVIFNIQGILGDVDAPGFAKDGNNYTNMAYGKTNHLLEFYVKGAIGSIQIIEK